MAMRTISSESISKTKTVARPQKLSRHLSSALDLVQLFQKTVEVVLAVMAVYGTQIQVLVNVIPVIFQHHMLAGDETQSALLALVLVPQERLGILKIVNTDCQGRLAQLVRASC